MVWRRVRYGSRGVGEGAEGRWAKLSLVLIAKTRREIWLNRVRVWLPPVFVAIALVLCRPRWHFWGLPLVVGGETIRTWAAGHLVKDETLTVGGPYGYVRNPLYVGSLLSATGILVVLGNWWLAAAFALVSVAIYLPTVRQEEDYLGRMHGADYEGYRAAVPGLIPRLRQAPLTGAGLRRSRFEWRWVWRNKEHRTWLALLALLALLAVRSQV